MKKLLLSNSFINSTIISLFGIGTIIVVFYMLTGSVLSVYVSLIAFALGFIILSINLIKNAILLSSTYERAENLDVKNNDFSDTNSKNEEVLAEDSKIDTINTEVIDENTITRENLKEEKDILVKKIRSKRNVEIFKAVMSSAFAVFTIIVLLLY